MTNAAVYPLWEKATFKWYKLKTFQLAQLRLVERSLVHTGNVNSADLALNSKQSQKMLRKGQNHINIV